MRLLDLLAVFLGGGAGSLLRHLAGLAGAAALPGAPLPFATLGVNVCGSFAIGALAAVLPAGDASWATLRLLLITGLLGGFTTFSAFSLETLTLWQGGARALAAGYVFLSVALSLSAAALAAWLFKGG